MQWLYWLGTYQSRNVLEAAKNSLSKLIKKIFFKNFQRNFLLTD